ncbi:MAG: alpha/beta hydrolase [Deltaproteobacteria bacterium]|jgi:pimeloyl-ACP methyl ester carboxylesterase|nr:alpha/beta hydrolase [Deltaproteobacteria bacterium]
MSVPVALALAVLAFCMLLALCNNLLYWYETINTPEPAIPAPKPGFVPCLVRYADSLATHLICVLLFPLIPLARRRVKQEGTTAGLPPLILIHGLYNNASVWLLLGRRLRRAGFPLSTCSYRSFFTSPQRIALLIEAHVRVVEAAFPGQKPIFVCHSLGGMLVRHWLLAPENPPRVKSVLTLGTPHQGSKIAALGPGVLAKNLLPDAPFIRELQQAPALAGLFCTALVSPTDEAVLPASNLLPPHGWKMRLTRRVGHFNMLLCPDTAALVLQELRDMSR